MTTAEDRARAAIRAALHSTGHTQVWLAAQLRISEKHMSHLITGRARLSFDLAQDALTALGRQLVIAVVEPDPWADL